MIILFFSLQCLFLFVRGLLCSNSVDDCGHLIKIYKDYECIHRFRDFESSVRVYSNASIIRVIQEKVTQQQNYPVRATSRINNAHLVLYPVLIPESPRYRADFHLEISQKDLVNVETILLVFSIRERNDRLVSISAVDQRITKLNGNCSEGYIRIGCYWHYIFFLANFQTTINLEMTVLRRNAPSSYGKYYFRIPYWERFNNKHDIDPCLFAPFAYVEENDQLDTEVICIVSVNCSRRAFVEVEQRRESSGELIKTHIIYTDEFGKGNITLKYTKALHYYKAFLGGSVLDKFASDFEVSGEIASIRVIMISVLISAVFILIMTLRCLKKLMFPPRNSVLFLTNKPRVKFVYSSDRKFHIYQAQTEILILFMQKYCNLIVANDSADLHETVNTSPLLRDFDIIIHIPFPSLGGNEGDGGFTTRLIREWEKTKKDCVILELPFWSESHQELNELCYPNTKWKKFVLMDEFFPMLRHIQRSRSCFHRRYVGPYNTDNMQRKLEESNLTNEGFLFCLKGAFGQSTVQIDQPPIGFQNLQDMEL